MPKSDMKDISNMDFEEKINHQWVFCFAFKGCIIVAFAILQKPYVCGKSGSRVIDENPLGQSVCRIF